MPFCRVMFAAVFFGGVTSISQRFQNTFPFSMALYISVRYNHNEKQVGT